MKVSLYRSASQLILLYICRQCGISAHAPAVELVIYIYIPRPEQSSTVEAGQHRGTVGPGRCSLARTRSERPAGGDPGSGDRARGSTSSSRSGEGPVERRDPWMPAERGRSLD